jgi:hypothetical protein
MYSSNNMDPNQPNQNNMNYNQNNGFDPNPDMNYDPRNPNMNNMGVVNDPNRQMNFNNMGYDPNQNQNMYYNAHQNMNNVNSNNMGGYNPNQGMNYNPHIIQPQVIQPQIVMTPVVPMGVACHKCGGSGMKIGKKGKAKPCKKCKGIAYNPNVQNVIVSPHALPYRRTWCGCLKVSKKGHNKCKVAKGCNIF